MSEIDITVGTANIVLDPIDEYTVTTMSNPHRPPNVVYRPADLTRALRVTLAALDVFDDDGIIDSAIKTIDGILGEDTVSV